MLALLFESLGSDPCLSVEELLVIFLLSAVSPPPYVRSSRSACTQSALTVAIRLCAPLQVTVGDRLLPRVRSVRSRSLLWPEFSKTHSSQAYMCTQCARRAVHHWLSCGWRNMLKLSQAPPSRENLFNSVWNPSTTLVRPALCDSMFNMSYPYIYIYILLYNTLRRTCTTISAPNLSSCSADRKWCSWGMESSTSGSLQRMTICSCTKIKPWGRWVLTQWRTCNRLLPWWARTLQSVHQPVCCLVGLLYDCVEASRSKYSPVKFATRWL